jgi:hypothetical protein
MADDQLEAGQENAQRWSMLDEESGAKRVRYSMPELTPERAPAVAPIVEEDGQLAREETVVVDDETPPAFAQLDVTQSFEPARSSTTINSDILLA